MGCGSSTPKSTSTSQQKNTVHNGILQNNHDSKSKLTEPTEANGVTQPTMKESNNNDKVSETEKQSQPLITNGHTIPTNQESKENISKTTSVDSANTSPKVNKHSLKAVAFEVKFEENSSSKEFRSPPKLKKLDHLPLLTAEMLANKQLLADENRQKEIEKKVAKTSKRKKQLLEARELDMKAQEKRLEIEEKMNIQNRKRARAQAQIIEKQRRRELRAKRVRERAQMIREGSDTVDFQLDPDETYNADEEDESWDAERTIEHHNNKSVNIQTHRKSDIDSEDEQLQDPKSIHDFFEE